MLPKTTARARESIGRVGQRRQVVIPKDICLSLRLQEGDFVAFAQRPDGVLIKPKKLVDPDDVLTAQEASLLKKSEQQMRQGRYVNLGELEHDLGSTRRGRSRKTA